MKSHFQQDVLEKYKADVLDKFLEKANNDEKVLVVALS
jgi:hypothetical protein